MIAFGSSISGAEAYRRYAEPGIHRAAEPDSQILAYAAVEPVARTYNLILEAAARLDDLEALVLVHPHTEILQPDLCARVRRALSDPDVGAVGCAGARNVTGIAWWEGEVVCGNVRQRYEEHGGGEVSTVRWADHLPPPAEVEVLDGQLLILSPWAVGQIRFDETLLLGHGFDLDFSLQLRQSGRRLLVVDLEVLHHRPIELVGDLAVWVEAHIKLAEKWDGTLRDPTADEETWKRRARRAEARREAARAVAMSESLKLDARVLELERQFEAMTSTASWRVTAPLRALNRRRRRASLRNVQPPDGA
ncbi:MAG TPA: glycosyltransferase [Solirubrobacteraceae bacterium]